MWKVRETQKIGVKVFYEVYRVMPSGDTIFRGRYEYEAEAQQLADKLNKEVADRERIQ